MNNRLSASKSRSRIPLSVTVFILFEGGESDIEKCDSVKFYSEPQKACLGVIFQRTNNAGFNGTEFILFRIKKFVIIINYESELFMF